MDLDNEYLKKYQTQTDEELYQYLREMASKLGRIPKKSEIPALGYIKSRLGNLPRMMERAGIKQISRKGTNRSENKAE